MLSTSGHDDGEREFDHLEEGDVQRLRDGVLSPVAVPHAVVGALLHRLGHDEEADERGRLEGEAGLPRHLSRQSNHFLQRCTAQRKEKITPSPL